MPGAILPVFRWQIFDNGVMAPGAKAYFYASGTSTPLAVYTNVGLTVAHAQPVVADAEGVLPIIFLQPLAYRVFVTDAAGATIFPAQDDILDLADVSGADAQAANLVYAGPVSGGAAVPTFRALVAADLPAASSLLPMVCEGRATLTSGTAVTTADVTAATALYWTPYHGNRLALYTGSGSVWVVRTFAELTQSLAGLTASTPYDLFGYDSAGVVALEVLAWANATTRATALALQDGVWCKSGALTRRLLASFYINSSGGQTDDSYAKRNVFTAHEPNRVDRPMRNATETANSWTYNSTYRQANANAANQLEFMVGLSDAAVQASVVASAVSDTASNRSSVGIGLDSTSANATGVLTLAVPSNGVNFYKTLRAELRTIPAVGRHLLTWLEFSQAGGATTTFVGDNNEPTVQQSGIHGIWRA